LNEEFTVPKPVVFISAPIHQAGIDLLQRSCELIQVHHPLASDSEIEAALARCDAVIIRSMPLTADRMDKAANLKVIAKHGAGMDSIDVPAATVRGIIVANSGDANSFGVAEHAVTLMLAVLRKVVQIDKVTRSGGFLRREDFYLGDLWEATVGVVGLGNIGRHTAEMVGKGFNAKVLGFDPMVSAAAMAEIGVQKIDELQTLLRHADIVSIHAPLNPHTHHLIGRPELAIMKSNAILVNTSRGGTVDEAGLLDALKSGSIAGAGIDVFEQEPTPASNPLFQLDNVVVSPHIGGGTNAARRNAALRSAEAALAVLDGRQPAYFLNREVMGHTRADV
jgi:D-3-phosphoglycerate dehydrogenase / 2-oxoglutarate reductase